MSSGMTHTTAGAPVARTMAAAAESFRKPALARATARGQEGRGRRTAGARRAKARARGSIKCHPRRGVVEIRDPRLFRAGREAFCHNLVQEAVETHEAVRAEVCLSSSTCRLEFEPGRFGRKELADRVAAAVAAATRPLDDGQDLAQNLAASWSTLKALAADAWAFLRRLQEDRAPSADTSDAPAALTSAIPGTPGLLDLALAGGSFVLAISGAMLPGVPGLPFFVLAGHYACRSSPTLRRILSRQPWYVAISGHGDGAAAVPPFDRRSLVKALAISALTAAALAILHPPLPVVLGIELVTMTFFCFPKAHRASASEPAWAA